MAILSYSRQTVGKTPVQFSMPIGSGGINRGELITSGGVAATSGDSAIEALAMEDGASGEDVVVMPLTSGIHMLKGTVDSAGSVTHGDNVGINNSFEIDADAANSLFIALNDGSSGETIELLVSAGV